MQNGIDIQHALSLITFWHWWILALLLVILEALAPGVIFLWMGIAAGVNGLILLAFPDMAWQQQFFAFAGLSLASVFAGRMWLHRHPTQSDHPTLNRRGEQYVGRRFTLSEPIIDGFGKIRVDDSTWRVSGEDMPQGEHVVVLGIDGSTFRVEKADPTHK